MKKIHIIQRLTILAAAFLLAMVCHAQEKNEAAINKVKKSKSYIYGEMTDQNRDAALKTAYAILQENIETWAIEHSKKKAKKFVATDVRHLVDTIFLKYNDHNLVRAFVYVKKSNLIPIYSKAGFYIIDTDAQDDAIANEQSNTIKEKVAEEKIEKVEDKPQTKNNIASTEQNVKSMIDEQQQSDDKPDQLEQPHFTAQESKVISKLQKVRSFFDLKSIILPLQESGAITSFGKYTANEDEDLSDTYLIIYDPAGNIRALLGKENEDGTRRNLKTNKDEELSAYRGCGAIWFTMKGKA